MLAAPSQTPESTSPSIKITRGHSCVLCQQRKVKCDRQKPCSNCIKSRAECVPSTVTVPRRRRKKLSEADLAAKLRRYEHLLKTHSVKFEDEDTAVDSRSNNEDRGEFSPQSGEARLSMNVPRPRDVESGALFADKEDTYYVEKYEPLRSTLTDWTLLTALALCGRISGMRFKILRDCPRMISTRLGCFQTQSPFYLALGHRLRTFLLYIRHLYRSSVSGKHTWTIAIPW